MMPPMTIMVASNTPRRRESVGASLLETVGGRESGVMSR
jgi:hypothetical protein